MEHGSFFRGQHWFEFLGFFGIPTLELNRRQKIEAAPRTVGTMAWMGFSPTRSNRKKHKSECTHQFHVDVLIGATTKLSLSMVVPAFAASTDVVLNINLNPTSFLTVAFVVDDCGLVSMGPLCQLSVTRF